MLWTPMFLSSVRLTISNPGFILGNQPDKNLSNVEKSCAIFMDLLLFLLHPIILQIRISSLKLQQDAIKKSRDMNLSNKYKENLAKIIQMEDQYFSYKRLELNLETIFQMTTSMLVYCYVSSETTTTNSLKEAFNEENSETDKTLLG